jgi:hypothetical protein
MRVCERHPRTRASGKIIIEDTDEHLDLCDQCLYDIKTFIGDTEQKLVEPKKGLKKYFAKAG